MKKCKIARFLRLKQHKKKQTREPFVSIPASVPQATDSQDDSVAADLARIEFLAGRSTVCRGNCVLGVQEWYPRVVGRGTADGPLEPAKDLVQCGPRDFFASFSHLSRVKLGWKARVGLGCAFSSGGSDPGELGSTAPWSAELNTLQSRLSAAAKFGCRITVGLQRTKLK